jgi:hypothetical protein
MGWDGIIEKNFRPTGWDGFQNLSSHPIPWDVFRKILSHGMGWDGMGWDGMGLSHPTRSPDAEYIRYFTGIKAIVLPSLCAYTKVLYMPKTGKPFLIAPIHDNKFAPRFKSMLTDSLQRLKASITVGHLREVYIGYYQYSQIAEHPGIIYVPYQVSVMSLFEQYRMNIPLFFPSLDLLIEWHYTHHIINQRTWDAVYGNRKNASTIAGVLGSDIPDPNNEFDRSAIRYWLQFSDFYQWPHITYYNSTEELAIKLTTTNLRQVSENMKIYNANLKQKLLEQWRQILERVAQ